MLLSRDYTSAFCNENVPRENRDIENDLGGERRFTRAMRRRSFKVAENIDWESWWSKYAKSTTRTRNKVLRHFTETALTPPRADL